MSKGSKVILAVTDIQAAALFALYGHAPQWVLAGSREHKAAQSIAKRGWAEVIASSIDGGDGLLHEYRMTRAGHAVAAALEAGSIGPWAASEEPRS